jgi:hypothetical protein
MKIQLNDFDETKLWSECMKVYEAVLALQCGALA